MANQNLFNSIKLTKPNRNLFDLSHDVKLSCNMGKLVPTMCMEVIPGDKLNIGCESLLRFQPLVSPVMHRMDVTMHYFFVPNRILWPNWDKFITNTKIGSPAALPAFPVIELGPGAGVVNRLVDYMGIPPGGNGDQTENLFVSALPFAAYLKIYDEYYRDQNLIPSVWEDLIDGEQSGPYTSELITLRNRAWEHDYFTAALPFAQKGDPVNLPLQFNDVRVMANEILYPGSTDVQVAGNALPGPVPTNIDIPVDTPIGQVGDPVLTEQLYADTSALTGSTTINDLRRATKLQEWLEKAARGGSRLVENILIFFGVRSPDARLQRPEYITGTKSPVVISEVLNTTGDTGATDPLPQGNMAGHAVSVTSGKYGGYFVQEHGYVIGIMSVLPKTAYMQGIPRHFFKTVDPFQYYWPQFANIGEQEVLNDELYAYTTTGTETFGYVPRYAEYKYEANRVAGEMRTSLDFWHLARLFANQPQLNQAFVESDPTTRIFAVIDADVDHLVCHVYHKIKASRLMPKFGTPTF